MTLFKVIIVDGHTGSDAHSSIYGENTVRSKEPTGKGILYLPFQGGSVLKGKSWHKFVVIIIIHLNSGAFFFMNSDNMVQLSSSYQN